MLLNKTCLNSVLYGTYFFCWKTVDWQSVSTISVLSSHRHTHSLLLMTILWKQLPVYKVELYPSLTFFSLTFFYIIYFEVWNLATTSINFAPWGQRLQIRKLTYICKWCEVHSFFKLCFTQSSVDTNCNFLSRRCPRIFRDRTGQAVKIPSWPV